MRLQANRLMFFFLISMLLQWPLTDSKHIEPNGHDLPQPQRNCFISSRLSLLRIALLSCAARHHPISLNNAVDYIICSMAAAYRIPAIMNTAKCIRCVCWSAVSGVCQRVSERERERGTGVGSDRLVEHHHCLTACTSARHQPNRPNGVVAVGPLIVVSGIISNWVWTFLRYILLIAFALKCTTHTHRHTGTYKFVRILSFSRPKSTATTSLLLSPRERVHIRQWQRHSDNRKRICS